jgi:RAB protein geranylgeranyltransferase component A
MKFMTQCVEFDKKDEEASDSDRKEFREYPKDGKFIELMKRQKLTDNLIHYILHSMCMGNGETTFEEGIEMIRTYLTSIGRYGNTPFLFPMYGCGELPQCFCRLCAVFGGIYCLGRPINDIKVIESNETEIVSMKFGDQNITAKKLVRGGYDDTDNNHGFISRAVFITTKPIGGSEVNSELDGGGAILLFHPPTEGRSDGVTLIQLAHNSGCVPKGLCKQA